MPDGANELRAYRKVLIAKRDTARDQCAKGLKRNAYWEQVGRCKALDAAIQEIESKITRITSGADDGKDD